MALTAEMDQSQEQVPMAEVLAVWQDKSHSLAQ
jgi:hypothetical protein